MIYINQNEGNPLGILGLYGLFTSGMWTFAHHHRNIRDKIPFFTILMSTSYVGRFYSLLIELWFCYRYAKLVVQKDKKTKA